MSNSNSPLKPSYLLPHENKELKLMLAGTKPLAFFSAENGQTPEDVGDAEFQKYVDDKIIKLYTIDNVNYQTRIYCLPTEEWRAKLILLIRSPEVIKLTSNIFTSNDLHRLDGILLGYSKGSVEQFVANLSK
jgi:hypothetical protein